jgi:fibronectin type 3 domain-containing protein
MTPGATSYIVNNRQMGLMVNGVVITQTERFPITGSFDVYQHSALQANLNAGKNSVVMFAVSDHGVPRVDELKVTPASASVPAGPTSLTATSGGGKITLSWTGSSGATQYQIYRGTAPGGEANTPIGVTDSASTAYVDTGLVNGALYYYNVSARNGVGVSPDSNEVAVVVFTN